MFSEKAILETFGKFLENHLQQSTHLKLIAMLYMNSVTNVFLGISQKVFRRAISKENLLMDAPYFIKENFWISASDEATLKNISGGSKRS